MKIYFHLCIEEFTNCYVIVNDDPNVMEAIIIDPGKISTHMIQQIEEGGFNLTGVLITHNHTNHVHGLNTLCKIYSPKVYAAESEVSGIKTNVLKGDGSVTVAGLKVQHYSVPGHTSDSLAYKIGNVVFTGDTLFAGNIGSTASKYSKRLLRNNLKTKILSQTDDTVLMPGHGPPTTVGTEKQFNSDIASED